MYKPIRALPMNCCAGTSNRMRLAITVVWRGGFDGNWPTSRLMNRLGGRIAGHPVHERAHVGANARESLIATGGRTKRNDAP